MTWQCCARSASPAVRSAPRWPGRPITLTAVALAAGIPAGVVCGRLAWRIFSGQLGILPVTAVPALSFALLVTAALLLAVAAAALPGEAAARVRPARALRSE